MKKHTGTPFGERDRPRDEAAIEELSEMGHMTTPVVKVDGEVVVGHNRKGLEQLLG